MRESNPKNKAKITNFFMPKNRKKLSEKIN